MFSKSLENQRDKGRDNLEETTVSVDQANGECLASCSLVCLINVKSSVGNLLLNDFCLPIASACFSYNQEFLKGCYVPKGQIQM